MKNIKSLFAAAAACALLLPAVSAFAGAKDYQVTGPIVSVTDTVLVVQKGKEQWEIARDPGTKTADGDLKVGDKITVHYTMTASSVENKGAAKPAASADAKKDKPAAAVKKDKGTAKPAAAPAAASPAAAAPAKP